jgi:putative ABC transport system permease protein
MAGGGIIAGAVSGYALTRLATRYFLSDMQMPSVLPVVASGVILLAAAVIASALPAMRASRVDVMQALRSD